uniref:Putative gustatory receptor 16 n=1 Tax=Conopomorpha sinensis TaxID=940481 RepID=A0A3Q8HNT9_9NEOP|nr:putative gustatory receptor 16 [Conopomorpha sinensis]
MGRGNQLHSVLLPVVHRGDPGVAVRVHSAGGARPLPGRQRRAHAYCETSFCAFGKRSHSAGEHVRDPRGATGRVAGDQRQFAGRLARGHQPDHCHEEHTRRGTPVGGPTVRGCTPPGHTARRTLRGGTPHRRQLRATCCCHPDINTSASYCYAVFSYHGAHRVVEPCTLPGAAVPVVCDAHAANVRGRGAVPLHH